MGSLVDSSVLIGLERGTRREPSDQQWPAALARLKGALPLAEEVAMSAVTVSELLHGWHRATPKWAAKRQAFLDNLFSALPVASFDVRAARVHAQLWANLEAAGHRIGPHDLIIAATAISLGWKVATLNVREFRRVPGLEVLEPEMELEV